MNNPAIDGAEELLIVICKRLICLLMVYVFSGVVYAQAASGDALVLSNESNKHSAIGYIWYLEDKQGKLDIQDILQPQFQWRFKNVGNKAPNFGLTKSAYWFQLQVVSGEDRPKTWWLEIQDPLLDIVDIYYKVNGELTEHIQLGDHYPFHERPVRVRNPVSILSLKPGERVEIIFRVKTYGAMHAPVFFWEPESYPVEALNLQMEYGIYYGIIGALILYNLMLFFSIRDVTYLYYCLFVLSYCVWQFSYNGLGYEFLWPNHGKLNLLSALLGSNFYTFFMLVFVRSFLRIPDLFPCMNKFIICVMSFGIIPLSVFLFFDQSIGVRINVFYLVMALCVISFAGVYAYYKKVVEARYFLIAWGVFIFGVLTFCMMFIGLLPANFLTIHGQQIGSASEAILLSFALAHRMRLLTKENERIRMQVKQNLENRVVQRTDELSVAMSELKLANEMLREKSFNDGLTGVRNRMYLESEYEKEWLRSRRERSDLAVLMIDLDHFKRVNDEHGHLCGDRALCFVADIVRKEISRPGDIIARYGGEEFLVVLPGTGNAGAYALAEKIRATLENTAFTYDNQAIQLTVSIGYAVQTATECLEDASSLLDAADQALYAAKHNGRNQVAAVA